MASSDEDDCVQRMGANIDDFAIRFVEHDEFLKKLPKGELQDLKDDLEPIFRVAYSRAHVRSFTFCVHECYYNEGDKLQALVDATKEACLLEKDDIILRAKDAGDCVKRMEEAIDQHAKDFVARDEFFRNVPQDHVDKVKIDLEPMFRKNFVTIFKWKCENLWC